MIGLPDGRFERRVLILAPTAKDAELASMFVIDAKNERAVAQLLKLADLKAVEFVEPEVRRELKR